MSDPVLARLAGQVLWCGWSATEPRSSEQGDDASSVNAHLRTLVDDLHVRALILFSRQLGTPEEIGSLVSGIRDLAPELVLATDQEGGRVCRVAVPGITFPGARALGSADDPLLTRAVHQSIGEQLAALGIAVDFAPVLDVNIQPHNPVIGVRSFGERPDQVIRHGIPAMQGLLDAGVIPVVKHFPGHGDTSVDSHYEMPIQRAARDRLDAVELAPFRAAIAAGAPAVMSSHILFTSLDDQLPATLSPTILTGMLRKELGFEGLIVTDCLEMEGIARHWSPEEAAVLALAAGADGLLVSHTLGTQARMHAGIVAAVRQHRLPAARLEEAASRMAALRVRSAAIGSASLRPDRVGSAADIRLEAEAARRALWCLKTAQPLWMSYPAGLSLGTTGVHATGDSRYVGRFEAAAAAAALPINPQGRRVHLAGRGERLPTDLEAAVLVACGEPYGIATPPEAGWWTATWGDGPPNMAALVEWLIGGTTSSVESVKMKQNEDPADGAKGT